MMDGFDEVIKEFLVESYESLDQLDRDLVELEDAPDDRDRLANIFRTVHTIKGTSGFLALPKLERVAHVGENLLVPLRDGELTLQHDMADGLLGMVDAIREILGHLENDEGEGDGDYEPLVATLEGLLHPGKASAETVPAIAQPSEEPAAAAEQAVAPESQAAQDSGTEKAVAEPTETSEHVGPQAESAQQSEPAQQPQPEQQAEPDHQVEAAQQADAEAPTDDAPVVQEAADVQQAAAAPSDIPAPPEPEAVAPQAAAVSKPSKTTPPAAETAGSSDTSSPARGDRTQSLADSTIRIDVSVLDKLMNLVGELVLSRNQIMQFSHSVEDPTIAAASQRLNLITTELQEGVMKTRMQPIRNAWSKLPRVVRDLASGCGKNVQVQMEGADTELDKTILEAIKDPLTHIVRNSVDHGIESSEDRVLAGKPEAGTLWLRAFHESGQVIIEIADDGRGINLDRVRQKAIENGLVTAEQAVGMNDRELTGLILLPGFSTAEKVTNVSGRGVGMDVVKTNIEKIGGTLDIQSITGKGTTLRIKIPLTLAIVPALVVKSGTERYAIPQVSLLELVRLDAERAEREIEIIYGTPVYRLRGNLLPLLYLDEQLKRREPSERTLGPDDAINIVVLQAEDRHFGLVVDGITDTQEIVVKPLGPHLKAIPTFAGATIMGDGSVSLILDVNGLAQQGGVLSEQHARALEDSAQQADQAADLRSWLVVDPGDETQAAVPLESVARLEEFAADAIERVGPQYVVQYRGEIMPLVDLQGRPVEHLDNDDDQRTQVVVYHEQGVSVGIVVKRIVDIVEQAVDADTASAHPERTVISGRVTRIIDPESLVRSSGVLPPSPAAA